MNKMKFLLVLALTLACFGVFASSWTAYGSKRKPTTLVVTGNFKSPRLMAELIQSESRQPYLLISSDNRYFVCYPLTQAVEVLPSKLNEYIRNLHLQRIIILGDENYVSQDFINKLDLVIPVARIQAKEWAHVARELDFMLNLGRLEKNFRALREQMRSNELNRPLRTPLEAQLTQPAETIPAAETVPVTENELAK